LLAVWPGCSCDETEEPADPSSTSASSSTSTGGSGGTGGDGGTGAIGAGGAGGDGGAGGGPGCQPPGDQTVRVDLLLAIDNSRSMADKQAILALTMPDLVQAFVNPRCVDADGVVAAQQPTDHTEPCPAANTTREFAPVTDLHIGIVSSSLGSHGADTCVGAAENDRGHLITRLEGGGTAPTYESNGFLAWDPGCGKDPPGETSRPP
jgi:hypothetical protein